MTTMLFYIMWDDCVEKRNQATSYLLYDLLGNEAAAEKLDKVLEILCEKKGN